MGTGLLPRSQCHAGTHLIFTGKNARKTESSQRSVVNFLMGLNFLEDMAKLFSPQQRVVCVSFSCMMRGKKILSCIENFVLCIDGILIGGWMNKAKLIWTTWRRTSVAIRDEYCVSH